MHKATVALAEDHEGIHRTPDVVSIVTLATVTTITVILGFSGTQHLTVGYTTSVKSGTRADGGNCRLSSTVTEKVGFQIFQQLG